MEYKASLDTLAKIITGVTIIIFVLIGYISVKAIWVSEGNISTLLIHIIIILFFSSIILFSYLYAPKSYSVDDAQLIINRPISKVTITLSDIEEVREISNAEMTGAIRTFGVGGLFGYYGKYYAPKIGHLKLYATQRRNMVLILTKQGQKILISPDDIRIIEKLKT